TAEAGQGHERRRLRRARSARGRRSDLGGRAGAARAEGVSDVPARRRRPSDRVRGGPELPRVHRGDAAAVRERGAPGTGILIGALGFGPWAFGFGPSAVLGLVRWTLGLGPWAHRGIPKGLTFTRRAFTVTLC